MSFLPTNTFLGSLRIIEIYDYYDKPLLFSCQNKLGQIFLVLFVDEDDKSTEWIYAPISEQRLKSVRSGAIDLSSAFINVENNYLISVITYHNNEDAALDIKSASSFLPDTFPPIGDFIKLPTDTLPKLETIELLAHQTNRNMIRLNLDFADKTTSEAPAKQLGRILSEFQSLIEVIAFSANELYKEATKIPIGIQKALELAVVGFGPGSFEVALASTPNEKIDMFDRNIFSSALEAMGYLIQLDPEIEQINRIVKDYSIPTVQHYLRFLQTIKPRIDKTEIEWVSVSTGRRGIFTIDSPRVIQTIDILKELSDEKNYMHEFEGILLGFDVHARTFRIDWKEKDSPIRGKVSRDVTVDDFSFMRSVTISKRYKAIIQEEVIYKIATDQTKHTYTLIKLSDV